MEGFGHNRPVLELIKARAELVGLPAWELSAFVSQQPKGPAMVSSPEAAARGSRKADPPQKRTRRPKPEQRSPDQEVGFVPVVEDELAALKIEGATPGQPGLLVEEPGSLADQKVGGDWIQPFLDERRLEREKQAIMGDRDPKTAR
jgi:hypothetical protein